MSFERGNREIPYGRQSITAEDIQAVVDVLKAPFLTQGPKIAEFEKALAARCGVPYAVAVASATGGLHIAYEAAGLGSGKRLWTSPNTFVASANCALYCGAEVEFVDIDPKTYNMSVARLSEKLEGAARSGALPDIVVPVHFSGQPCDLEEIRTLSRKYGFKVVEDAAHALGADYRGSMVGSCAYSDLTVMSFHPVKMVTTGEGGAILTRSSEFYEKLLRLRSHGITRDPARMKSLSLGPWYYEQIDLGYHYRITDMQAALGLSQLKRLDQFIERRRALAKRYYSLLEGLPVVLPFQQTNQESSWHLYVIRLLSDRLKWTHRQVFEALRARGIGVNLHYYPVPLQPYYRDLGFKAGMFPEAERYASEAITLPLYYELSDEEQDYVAATLKDVLLQAERGS